MAATASAGRSASGTASGRQNTSAHQRCGVGSKAERTITGTTSSGSRALTCLGHNLSPTGYETAQEALIMTPEKKGARYGRQPDTQQNRRRRRRGRSVVVGEFECGRLRDHDRKSGHRRLPSVLVSTTST